MIEQLNLLREEYGTATLIVGELLLLVPFLV